ncbi:hypothetical protein [Bradyrhizobium murdochi]|uniref:hypothetical protein n=1 Tax=Bradyrhizobium murdochi TaxID=1038859 RepID=UPI0004836D32|nr:hypothetical protein [Bradyrhizobium murdochi]
MTDAEIIVQLEKALESLRARQSSKTPLPALTVAKAVAKPRPAPAAPPSSRPVANAAQPRWKPAVRAFADRGFPFDDWLVRRICSNHDWALKLPGGWHVDHAKFDDYATLVELRQATFNTTQKYESSESSVANSA